MTGIVGANGIEIATGADCLRLASNNKRNETMRTTIAASAALGLALAFSPASAAPPADQDACNALAFGFAEQAATKGLAEAAATKVDKLIAKLEVQCSENKFKEADATAKEVEAALK